MCAVVFEALLCFRDNLDNREVISVQFIENVEVVAAFLYCRVTQHHLPTWHYL